MSIPGEHSLPWPSPERVAEAAEMTDEVLAFAAARGSNLMTPPNPDLKAAPSVALLLHMVEGPDIAAAQEGHISPAILDGLAARDAARLVLALRVVEGFGGTVTLPPSLAPTEANDGQ
jgi:hypothetical protein